MTKTEDSKLPETPNGNDVITSQQRGETVAYAVQSGIYNLGANFFEPYINYRFQKHYSGADAVHPKAHGNYSQNLMGEFAGDIIGASTLVVAESLFPHQLHACTRTMRGWVDPLYSTVAHRVFANEKDSPEYEQKVEKWKTFQERNLARSVIIASAGIAGNIATQKMFIGNPSPTSLILQGKLLTTAITTTLVLVIRLAFPEKTKGIDNWMSKNIFAPMMEDKANIDIGPGTSHVEKLMQQKNDAEFKEIQ